MLYYTAQLRPYNGMIVIAGQFFIEIPPLKSNVQVTGSCVSECTDKWNVSSVNIAFAGVHMHLLGRDDIDC